MSELLKNPNSVGFDENPLYISVDAETNKMLNSRNIRDKSERKRFIEQALGNDTLSMPGRIVRIYRIDSSGAFEIKPETIP